MSSIATDEDIVDRWIEIDDSISVPDQTLEEILADKVVNFDDELSGAEEDDSSMLTVPASSQSLSALTYQLDSPIRISLLESVSHQVKSQYDRKYGGAASALAASARHVAVATSRGLVLVFVRETQRLEHCLTSDGCPVSCLDFNMEGSRLAVGYAAGHIRIISVASGKVVEDTTEVVQPGRGVLQIAFLGSGRRLVVVDSGGSVYEFHTSSRMRSRTVRCVFSGCHGEVVYVKSIASDRFLALISLTKLFLISLPQAELIFTSPCNGPADRPPLIDWQFVDFKVSASAKVRSAVFCLGRGSRIDIFRLNGNTASPKSVSFLRTLLLEFSMINLKWIDPFHLLALDSSEKIHLLDTSRDEIAVEDLSYAQLVYSSSDFKGLSTGGNVSSALQFLSTSVCYESVRRVGDSVFVLGRSSVYSVTLTDQLSQIERYVERGDILSAILYAVDIFSGKVVNKSSRVDLRHSVSALLPSLINKLLGVTTAGLENGKVNHLIEHYRKHINLLVRTCVATSRFDLLYNTIYPCLEKDALSKAIFFEFIDEIVLDGLLENPPPSLVSEYLHFLVSEDHLNQFEAAVVRIPIDRQDIHYVMTTCQSNHLYDGIIYIYNKALSDFLGPLEEMFENVGRFVDREMRSDSEIEQGNKLLLYVQCCLAGRAYPFGSLPDTIADSLPLEVYRCLISLKGKDGTSASSSETYPYLRLLLKFDAQHFFNVICTCADCSIFAAAEGRLQRLTEIIYQIVLSMNSEVIIVAHFLSFIAYLLQRNAIIPSMDMISELIESVLSSDSAEVRVAELDVCIVELLRTVSGLNETKILKLARRLPHLQVCAYIYTNQRDFVKLVECYLCDSLNAVNVFAIIRNLLCELSHDEIPKFSAYVRSSILKLAAVDGYQTAELVLDHFIDWLNDPPSDAEYAPLLFYNCFLVRRERGHRTLTGDEDLDERLFSITVEDLLSDEHDEARDEKLVERLRYWLPIGSRSDRCLNLAVSCNLFSSTVMLLEARKLVGRAFELLFCELEKCWLKDEERVVKYVDEIMRISNIHQTEARDGKWLLRVLHKLLTLPEQELDENTEIKLRLNDIIAGIVQGGSGGAELLVDSLFVHPVFRHATYGKFRPLITSIFDSCRYEKVLLEMTVKCIESESREKLRELVSQSTQRASQLVLSNECAICSKPPHKSSFLFSCGHSIHLECEREGSSRQCPCAALGFGFAGVSNNLLNVKPSATNSSSPNIFDEQSLRLALGPNRLDS